MTTPELPTVVEALEATRVLLEYTKKDMAAALGISNSNYSEILAGRRRLPLPATKKAYKIGIPAKVLLQEEDQNHE